MILMEDTSQQEKKHSKKHKYFLENGIHWNRSTLICGDYQIAGNGSVAVDTKFSIQELIGDIQFKAMSKKDIENQIRENFGFEGTPIKLIVREKGEKDKFLS